MRHLTLKAAGGFLLAAMLSVPALADTPTQRGTANPGTINYVEGQVSIGNEPIGANSAGSAVLGPDQILTTQSGKAEVLLTPGVFARVGDNPGNGFHGGETGPRGGSRSGESHGGGSN